MERGNLSAYQIGKQQKITPRHVRRLYKRYRSEPHELNRTVCLRPLWGERDGEGSSDYERGEVLKVKKEMGFGAVKT